MLMELFFESFDTCVNYFACHSIGRGGGAHEKSQDKVIKICHSLLYNTPYSQTYSSLDIFKWSEVAQGSTPIISEHLKIEENIPWIFPHNLQFGPK